MRLEQGRVLIEGTLHKKNERTDDKHKGMQGSDTSSPEAHFLFTAAHHRTWHVFHVKLIGDTLHFYTSNSVRSLATFSFCSLFVARAIRRTMTTRHPRKGVMPFSTALSHKDSSFSCPKKPAAAAKKNEKQHKKSVSNVQNGDFDETARIIKSPSQSTDNLEALARDVRLRIWQPRCIRHRRKPCR